MSELSDHRDYYTLIEEDYEHKIRKLQNEAMRTGIDNSEEYERIRSNYVLDMIVLDTRRAVSRIS